MLDAIATGLRTTVTQLVREERLGIDLGAVHPELRSLRASSLLPARPASSIICRHTVGMLDPLTDADIAAGARVDDGLPQSLEASIQAYGLFHFKLKVDGNQPDAALERLRSIFAVLTRQTDRRMAFTIDGNESFASAEAFRAFWEKVEADSTLRDVLPRLLFVEQPMARAVALNPGLGDLSGWAKRPPIIIDESDAEPEDLRRALDLGYVGTSHKNCKGVFKGIAHASLIRHRSVGRSAPLLHSGEDLSNIGPVAVQQDLAAQAMLGTHAAARATQSAPQPACGRRRWSSVREKVRVMMSESNRRDMSSTLAGAVPRHRDAIGRHRRYVAVRGAVESAVGDVVTHEEMA